MKRPEFAKGPKAKEKFERTMTAPFQVRKTGINEKTKENQKKGKD